jgi:4-oxalomesaconate hydratase
MICRKRESHHDKPKQVCAGRQRRSADFVWRAGCAIAVHAEQGFAVTVICLSYASAVKARSCGASTTLERVKSERQKEVEKAAKPLGVADIQFWDLGDYPIALNQDSLYRSMSTALSTRLLFSPIPNETFIITTTPRSLTLLSTRALLRTSPGRGALFLFEPHQPEQCDWTPNVLLDITAVWEEKRAAIECMVGQEHLWAYYTRVALQRGAQAARNYGEGCVAVFTCVVERLA